MAFFLLGRVDDTLNLLCPDTFASRQDALAALSRVTSESGFDLWDAEVLLLDTDSGTPVLLVRPQVAQVPAVEADATSEVVVADDTADELLETVVVDEVLANEAEAQIEIVAEAEVEAEVEAPTSDAEEDAVPAVRVETVPDVDVVSPVESALVEADVAVIEESVDEDDAAATLRDALSRTAAQMEAEGIVAPDSIGAPEPAASEADSATVADKDWPWDVAGGPEPTVSQGASFVPDELEEPSLDDASILRGSIDDDTFAAARPVIMGSYAEPREETLVSEALEEDLPVESMGLTELESEAAPTPTAADDAESAADQDISDVILDLGSVPHAEPTAEVAQVFDDMPGVVEHTCDDCIYEDTCPNRDQRLPKDCVSFSWR